MNRLVYPAEESATSIGAALQANVRDIAAAAGLKVGNRRIMPARRVEGFEQIGLSLTVSGEMSALDQALVDFAAFSPVLLVESIEVKPSRQTRRSTTPVGQTVVATVQLLTLRVRP